jgi:hypothetical protein
MTDTKVCACGCGAEFNLSGSQCQAKFAQKRFATLSCAMRWRNAHATDAMVATRYRGIAAALIARGYRLDNDGGALVTPAEWLDEPPARIRAQRQAQGIRL